MVATRDVMTSDVVTIEEQTSLREIASILEHRHIKRVPVTRDGKLVGIVSRADLLRGLAVSRPAGVPSLDDRKLQAAIEDAIRSHSGPFVSVTVTGGVAHLWGGVEKPSQKDAARVATENVTGVRSVEDRIRVFPPNVRALLWAE